MPKKINDFGITAKEACENTKKLGDEFARIKTMKEAEERTKDLAKDPRCSERIVPDLKPLSESETICNYWTPEPGCPCPGAMGDERYYVIKNGIMVMAHRRCHKRDQDGEKKTPNVIIR